MRLCTTAISPYCLRHSSRNSRAASVSVSAFTAGAQGVYHIVKARHWGHAGWPATTSASWARISGVSTASTSAAGLALRPLAAATPQASFHKIKQGCLCAQPVWSRSTRARARRYTSDALQMGTKCSMAVLKFFQRSKGCQLVLRKQLWHERPPVHKLKAPMAASSKVRD